MSPDPHDHTSIPTILPWILMTMEKRGYANFTKIDWDVFATL